MQICRVSIENFRGIQQSTLVLPKHAVLLGDNNTGKTTILEAIDLVLGPDRLNRTPPIDEHDFYHGIYLPQDAGAKSASHESEQAEAGVKQASPRILIEATVTGLSEEQQSYFGGHI